MSVSAPYQDPRSRVYRDGTREWTVTERRGDFIYYRRFPTYEQAAAYAATP